MNVHDSEKLEDLLRQYGGEVTRDESTADVIVLNTCAVRAKAEQKVYSRLGRLSHLKQKRPDLKLVIAGCMAQAWGSRILERAPYVDVIVGPGSLFRIPEILREMHGEEATDPQPVVEVVEPSAFLDVEPRHIGKPRTHHAWITVMEGCDNFCSYCVVPYVRGRERSRREIDIIEEIEHLVTLGVREITLLGQNVNSYRGENGSFANLLRMLDSITGLLRIRFTTSHPKDVSQELIAAIAELPKVCEYLHFPAQSGSDTVLTRMKRGYSRADYIDKVASIRDRIPGIAMSSDFIVGFPGETEADFEETLDLVNRVQYDSIFAFHYSVRPMTAAARFPDDVTHADKLARLERLITLQRSISLALNSQSIGSVVEVLVEGTARRGEGKLTGRTRQNRIVNFTGDAQISSLQPVRIESVSPNCLYGTSVG